MPSAAHAAIFVCALEIFFMSSGLACTRKRGEEVRIAEVVDAARLRLADGRELKLAGIAPPPSAPWSEKAHLFLAGTVAQGPLALEAGKTTSDRYGRLVGDLLLADGVSAREHLVAAGLARVVGADDTKGCIAGLLTSERRARERSQGIWADPVFAVRDANDIAALESAVGSFQIVEGRVAHVATIRKRIYFNFGEDWRTDFTVTVAPADARLFEAGTTAIGNPASLEGRHVRVRGFVERFNGPELTISRPEDIELLSGEREPDVGGAANADGRKRER